MIIHRSPLDDYHTGLYNLMCAIEAHIYTTCDGLMSTYKQYIDEHGMPDEWSHMSTDEWYQHYDAIENDTSDESMAAKAYFRIIFGWDFLEEVQAKFDYQVRKYMDKAKRAWEWLDMITNRALEMFRHSNKHTLGFV